MQLKSGQQQQQQRLQTTEQTSTYELIVVSSQKSDSNTESEPATKSISDVKEKFNNVAVSELPAIKGSKRHTWQTMKKWVSLYQYLPHLQFDWKQLKDKKNQLMVKTKTENKQVEQKTHSI